MTFQIFQLGGGEGESEAPGRGGGRILLENPRRGEGVLPGEGGSSEGLGGCRREILGGGTYCFLGQIPTQYLRKIASLELFQALPIVGLITSPNCVACVAGWDRQLLQKLSGNRFQYEGQIYFKSCTYVQ